MILVKKRDSDPVINILPKRRLRWENVVNDKDMMVTTQAKCGCVFGEIEGRKKNIFNVKGVLYCEKHEPRMLRRK